MSTSYTPVITPSSSAAAPSTDLNYISRAKQRVYSTLSTRRPWRQFFDYRSLSFPRSPFNLFTRLRTNLAYFRVNFAIFVLLVLFIALLWHPISLLVFAAMMVAWLFLFFLRDQPLSVFGRAIDDRIVLAVLSVLTVLFLFLTSATVNILVGLAVGLLVVIVYSVARRTDDLFLDEEAAAAGGLVERSSG